MRIRRLTIRLPQRMKDTAQHDARAIGEVVAQALWENGGQAATVNIPGQGQRGALLAQRVGAALPKGKVGGKGNGS